MMIDYEKLRAALIEYYGSAMPFMPIAVADVAAIESADEEELVRLAKKCGIDLNRFVF